MLAWGCQLGTLWHPCDKDPRRGSATTSLPEKKVQACSCIPVVFGTLLHFHIPDLKEFSIGNC